MAGRRRAADKRRAGATVRQGPESRGAVGLSWWPRVRRWMPIALVVVLAGIPFAAGKYMELATPGPFDSGAYAYSAYHVLQGAGIGVEEIPSAKLGTLLVNMLGVALFGYSDVGPKLVQMAMQAGALALMFVGLRRAFGTLAAGVSVVVASLYLSAPLLAKFGNVKEQYMIAVMVAGISCLMLRYAGGRWWWAVLAGAFLAWGPLFKETGVSALGAAVVFVILQPILKHVSWRRTGVNAGLLAAGFVGSLLPVFVWMEAGDVRMARPYESIWRAVASAAPGPRMAYGQEAAAETPGQPEKAGTSSYVERSREQMPLGEQAVKVFRFYKALIVPVGLAIGAIAARVLRLVLGRKKIRNPKHEIRNKARISEIQMTETEESVGGAGGPRFEYDWFVVLLGVWWLLDMAFVWISPRSYEQYYLPLTASGAMTGGYLVALWRDVLRQDRLTWGLVGVGAGLFMVAGAWPVVAGLKTSPHTGNPYQGRDRGYVQRWREVKLQGVSPWRLVAEYVREHTEPEERIYVWGWYPGIYVEAGRLSSASKAFEGEMHTMSPGQLARTVEGLLGEFRGRPPEYIVDTRKQHFPWDRPPLEFWPRGLQREASWRREGPPKEIVEQYEREYRAELAERVGEEEARRFDAMRPMRGYVVEHYRVVPAREVLRAQYPGLDETTAQRAMGGMVLLERKQGGR